MSIPLSFALDGPPHQFGDNSAFVSPFEGLIECLFNLFRYAEIDGTNDNSPELLKISTIWYKFPIRRSNSKYFSGSGRICGGGFG